MDRKRQDAEYRDSCDDSFEATPPLLEGVRNSQVSDEADRVRRTRPPEDGARWVQRMLAPSLVGFDVTRLSSQVQRGGEARDGDSHESVVHELANVGVQSAGEPLPYLDRIQKSFGPEH